MRIDKNVPCSACNKPVQTGELVIRPSEYSLNSLSDELKSKFTYPHYWHVDINPDNLTKSCAFSLFSKLSKLSSGKTIYFESNILDVNRNDIKHLKIKFPTSESVEPISCTLENGKLYARTYLCSKYNPDKEKIMRDAQASGATVMGRRDNSFKKNEIYDFNFNKESTE
jgi:hypothetical protein